MDFSLVLIGIVMFIALVGMIVCSKKQKTNPNAQPVAIALLIIVVVCGFMMMYKTGVFGSGGAEQFRQIEDKYYASQGNVLGKYIAKNFADQKILLIAERNFSKDPRVNVLVGAIKEGMGGKADIQIDTIELANPPKVPKGAPDMMEMPLAETMTSKDFDNTLQKHTDCTVVVSTIGLPRENASMKLWKMDAAKRPKVLLMGAVDLRSIADAIRRDLVAAVITISPDAKFTEDAPPSDPQKAFDTRYVLINKASLDKFGKLFN
jgi:hypothetical protein